MNDNKELYFWISCWILLLAISAYVPFSPISKLVGENTPIFADFCLTTNTTYINGYFAWPTTTQLQRDWFLTNCAVVLCKFNKEHISSDYCKNLGVLK